eukprot:UN02299
MSSVRGMQPSANFNKAIILCNHFAGSQTNETFWLLVMEIISVAGNHFFAIGRSCVCSVFTKLLVISLMGSRNHFLGPYFPLRNYW